MTTFTINSEQRLEAEFSSKKFHRTNSHVILRVNCVPAFCRLQCTLHMKRSLSNYHSLTNSIITLKFLCRLIRPRKLHMIDWNELVGIFRQLKKRVFFCFNSIYFLMKWRVIKTNRPVAYHRKMLDSFAKKNNKTQCLMLYFLFCHPLEKKWWLYSTWQFVAYSEN